MPTNIMPGRTLAEVREMNRQRCARYAAAHPDRIRDKAKARRERIKLEGPKPKPQPKQGGRTMATAAPATEGEAADRAAARRLRQKRLWKKAEEVRKRFMKLVRIMDEVDDLCGPNANDAVFDTAVSVGMEYARLALKLERAGVQTY